MKSKKNEKNGQKSLFFNLPQYTNKGEFGPNQFIQFSNFI